MPPYSDAPLPQQANVKPRFVGSIRTYLNALVLAVLAPLLAFALLLAANYARSQSEIIEAQRNDVVNNLGFLVDREIESVQSALKVLSVSPEVRSGQFDLFGQHIIASLPIGARVALIDRSGEILVSSGSGDEPRRLPERVLQLRDVFEGKLHISGFRAGLNGQAPSYAIAVPVSVDGRIAYGLRAEIPLARLNSLFQESNIKPRWLAAIVDSEGRILARNVNVDRFAGMPAAPIAADIARGTVQSGVFDSVSLEGVETSNAYFRSPVTGWTLFVAVPKPLLHAPLFKAYRFVAVIGLGLTGLSLGLAYLLADRISGAVRGLKTAAVDVVDGREVAPVSYPIAELGQVAHVFEYAAAIAVRQKSDERKLKESEERQRLAIEAGSFATWDLDVTNDVSIWSPAVYSLLGYPHESESRATRGMWRDRVHPDDIAWVEAEVENARLARRAYSVEYRIVRADTNEVRWLRSNGQFHYDSASNTRRLIGVVRDVTERKLLEISLRENETRYRSALTVGRMGSWETNFATHTRKWTPEAQMLFGLALPDGIGHVGGRHDEYLNAIHPQDKAMCEQLQQLAHTTDSFPAEYRIIRHDGTVVWLSGRGQVFSRGSDGRCERLVSVMADVTEQKKSSEHLRFLLREMSHRSKNLLAVVQSIASQTIRTSGSMAEFHNRFEKRLQGLAASHDILVDQNWEGASLSSLVQRQLAPFVDVGSARLQMSGPDVDLTTSAAQAVGLALHELATNAVKYGALSGPNGKIVVSWDFDTTADEPGLLLVWMEQGGPIVSPPVRRGFGNAVIERMAPSSVSGSVSLEFAPGGLCWKLTIPRASLICDQTTASIFPAAPRLDEAV